MVSAIADAQGWDVQVTDAEHADSGVRFEVLGQTRPAIGGPASTLPGSQ
jgi:hypothetical protein